MRQQALIGVAVVGILLIVGIMARRDEPARYSASEVLTAFSEAGAAVRVLPQPAGSVASGSALMPSDDRFTVLVLSSEAVAESAFAPYLHLNDAGTFQARRANVIVLADGSNSSQPLPNTRRAQIMAALDLLAAR